MRMWMHSAGLIPNTATFTSLVDCCCRLGRMSDAEGLLHDMYNNNVSPNTATFTCMIDGYGKAARLDDAFAVIGLMTQAGAKPNVPTFTALLCACFQCEAPARSREVLQLMGSHGLDAQELPQQLLRQAASF